MVTDMGQISTMATGLSCPDITCGYTTTTQVPDETDLTSKIELLRIHRDIIHPQGGASADHIQGLKAEMDAPILQVGGDQQTWDWFMLRWGIVKATIEMIISRSKP